MKFRQAYVLAVLLLTLAAVVAACDPDERRFPTENSTDPLPSSLKLSTSTGALTLPADGISTLLITAEIPPGLVTPTRKVRFRTSSGSFAGAAASATQIDVSFETDGRAVSILHSSTTPGPVVVGAQIVDGMNETTTVTQIQLQFVVPDAEGLRFIEAPSRAPADGASTTRFTVQVLPALPLDNRTVTFTTSLGSFDGGTTRMTTVNAGVDGQASVLLYSAPDDGQGLLAASLGMLFRIENVIRFEPAPAETILVETPARVALGGSAPMKATLVRSIGTPTLGTVVTFRAFDQAGTMFGSFHNVTLSGAGGVATAEFRPGRTATPGPCRIAVTAGGSAAIGRARFELVAAGSN